MGKILDAYLEYQHLESASAALRGELDAVLLNFPGVRWTKDLPADVRDLNDRWYRSTVAGSDQMGVVYGLLGGRVARLPGGKFLVPVEDEYDGEHAVEMAEVVDD